MVTGGNGPSGEPAAKPVDQEIVKDPGNVTHLLLLMEAKNVKELMRKQRSVAANPVQVLDILDRMIIKESYFIIFNMILLYKINSSF